MTATNRLDEAESQIETALQQTPDEPETVFVAARIAELTGRRQEAVALYRRFLALAPSELRDSREMAERRIKALGEQ